MELFNGYIVDIHSRLKHLDLAECKIKMIKPGYCIYDYGYFEFSDLEMNTIDLEKYLRYNGYVIEEYSVADFGGELKVILHSVSRDESNMKCKISVTNYFPCGGSEYRKLFSYALQRDILLDYFFEILSFMHRGQSFDLSLKILRGEIDWYSGYYYGTLYNELTNLNDLDLKVREIIEPKSYYLKNYNVLSFRMSSLKDTVFYNFIKTY